MILFNYFEKNRSGLFSISLMLIVIVNGKEVGHSGPEETTQAEQGTIKKWLLLLGGQTSVQTCS